MFLGLAASLGGGLGSFGGDELLTGAHEERTILGGGVFHGLLSGVIGLAEALGTGCGEDDVVRVSVANQDGDQVLLAEVGVLDDVGERLCGATGDNHLHGLRDGVHGDLADLVREVSITFPYGLLTVPVCRSL